MQLHYNHPLQEGTPALYNGNISELGWQTATDHTERGYSYRYDALDRLNEAYFIQDGQAAEYYNVTGITYDENGNIETLQRKGSSAVSTVLIDDLHYTYDKGNQLQKVADASKNPEGFNSPLEGGAAYTYDANGSLTADKNKGITQITYNFLHLPQEVIFSSGNKIEYTYNAAGVKLSKKVTNSGIVTTTDYLNGYQYKNGQLQFYTMAEGYVKIEEGKAVYIYNYTDHLGNVRLSYTDKNGIAQVLQEKNYYPFGLTHKGYNETNLQPYYHYGYNGKEFTEDLGYNMQEMDNRQFDPAIARWTVLDPIVHYNSSPYSGFEGNPIFWSDPSGANVTESDDGWTFTGQDAQDFFRGLQSMFRGGANPPDDYIFDQNGDFVRIDENDQPDRLVVENSQTGYRKNYQFADPIEDPKAIKKGIINKLVFVSKENIIQMLKNQGVFNPINKNNWANFYKESLGTGKYDYSYSVIPKWYESVGASFFPLKTPSSLLFLPEGDYMVHNHMNFGNFLWGSTGYTLGFNYATLQLGAHFNSLVGRRNGYPSQWDSRDDQISIVKGAYYARRNGFR